MNVEKRLRDALGAERDRAAAVEASPRKWESVRGRARGNRARGRAQQLVVIGLSAAAVVAVIVGVMLGGDKESKQGLIDTPPGAPGEGPAYVVTAEATGVFVRSASNGEVLHELVPSGDAGNLQRVAVSPDGSYVYFERAVEISCPEGQSLRSEILRVPIGGGAPEVVTTNGSHPTISPTGTYLAYVTDGSQDGCGGTYHLMRRTIGVAESDTTIASLDTFDNALYPIGWSKDETVILTETARFESAGAGPTLVTLEGQPLDSNASDVTFPSDPEQETPAVLLGPRTAAAYVDDGDGGAIASFDTKTGAVSERLFELPRRPASLEVDASGSHFLATVEATDGYTIYRWDEDNGLESLGDTRVRDVAWARGAVAAPKHFAAVTPDGELQIRETPSGDVVKTFPTRIDMRFGPPRLAPTPDGRHIYIEDALPCDDGSFEPRILRVDIATGEVGEVGPGADPAVSADGSKLAYVTGDSCGQTPALLIRDLVGGETKDQSVSGSVSMPHWSPDGRMIAFDRDGVKRLFDTVEGGDAGAIPVDEYTKPGGYLTEDEILAFSGIEDTSEIVTIDPASGARRRFIAAQPGVHDDIAVEAVDGEHILYTLRDPSAEGAREPNVVFRYSLGDVATRVVADDVLSVAWLDGYPADAGSRPSDDPGGQPTPAPTPSTAPIVSPAAVAHDCSAKHYQPGYLPEGFFDPEPEFPETPYEWAIRFRNDSMSVTIYGGYSADWGETPTRSVDVMGHDGNLGNPDGVDGHLAVDWYEQAGSDCMVQYAVVSEGVSEDDLLRVANSLPVD